MFDKHYKLLAPFLQQFKPKERLFFPSNFLTRKE